MANPPLILASRRSALALCQAELARAHVSARYSDRPVEVREFVTTGDKKTQWSLEKQGGKGLFTKELEDALLAKEADVAVHSAKDLPTEMPEGLVIAAFLPRESVNDILVVREEIARPVFIATSSPRRRLQLKQYFPSAVWSEIRGNVETRMKKILNGQAEATVLAAAGLKRLGVLERAGLALRPLTIQQVVPAVGQGAIALQCRVEDYDRFRPLTDPDTTRAVELERKFLAAMGGGCHTATAGHFAHGRLYTFHEDTGRQEFHIPYEAEADLDAWIEEVAEAVRG